MLLKSRNLLVLALCLLALQLTARAAGAQEKSEPVVRVGLILQAERISFTVDGNYQLVDCSNQKPIFKVAPHQLYEVRYASGGLELYREGQRVGFFGEPVMVQEEPQSLLVVAREENQVSREAPVFILGAQGKQVFASDLRGLSILAAGNSLKQLALERGPNLITLFYQGERRRYRGSMEFRVDSRGITAINHLPVEEYLYAVVPSEMPASWPLEALKAQAVAARSYVLANRGSNNSQGFDVLADQKSQVYRGYDVEHPAATRAVEETRGVVLTYRGQVANVVFHSSSGGYTENSEDVWVGRLEYLRSRPDPFDRHQANPHYNWSVTYTAEQLKEQLASRGYQFSQVHDLEILERTTSGARVKSMRITGLDTSGRPLVVEIGRDPAKPKADEVRWALGLKSAFFTMEKVIAGTSSGGQHFSRLVSVTFRGNGWGHGLGMSQYGALGMAEKGYSYQEILQYYYPGTTLVLNYGEKRV